jgi:hypothetical protein
MLADNAAEGQPAFARATPFAPNERRHHAKSGKGFLFGDEEGENSIVGEQARKSSPARRGSRPRGKEKPATALRREEIGLLPVDHTESGEGNQPLF